MQGGLQTKASPSKRAVMNPAHSQIKTYRLVDPEVQLLLQVRDMDQCGEICPLVNLVNACSVGLHTWSEAGRAEGHRYPTGIRYLLNW